MGTFKRAINYDIHPNPHAKGQPTGFHPRVAEHQLISMEQLLSDHFRPSQVNDLRMHLQLLLDAMKEEMRCGNTVHIEGLGTFAPTLAADVTENPSPRGEPYIVENLRVDSIAYRPEKRFMESLQNGVTFRYEPQLKGQYLPEDYYEPILTDFFSKPYNLLSRAAVKQLLGVGDYPAKCLLKKLVADGALIPVGGHGSARYMPAPGHFGR